MDTSIWSHVHQGKQASTGISLQKYSPCLLHMYFSQLSLSSHARYVCIVLGPLTVSFSSLSLRSSELPPFAHVETNVGWCDWIQHWCSWSRSLHVHYSYHVSLYDNMDGCPVPSIVLQTFSAWSLLSTTIYLPEQERRQACICFICFVLYEYSSGGWGWQQRKNPHRWRRVHIPALCNLPRHIPKWWWNL